MRFFFYLFVFMLPTSLLADKLPYNSKFPRAEYPFAQAADGCSSWDVNYKEFVRDDWGIFGNFTGTCNAHDRCYYTLGTTARQCNEEFKVNIHKACKKLEWAFFDTCRNIANKYQLFVDQFSDEVFPAAQDMQARYIEYSKSFLNDSYVFFAGEKLSENWIEYYQEFLKISDILGVKQDMILRFGKQIVENQFSKRAGYPLPPEKLGNYIVILENYGFVELWSRIALQDFQIIIDARLFALVGALQPDDEIMYSIKNNFIASKDVARLDEDIRAFYINYHPPIAAPSAPSFPQCDASKMSSWDYLDCTSK